jgi:hypothetical protein
VHLPAHRELRKVWRQGAGLAITQAGIRMKNFNRGFKFDGLTSFGVLIHGRYALT